MKLGVVRREKFDVGVLVVVIVVVLAAVITFKPDSFNLVLAIAGTAGGLLVLYEVHHTKLIARAEFIRDLNTAFSADENISRLWAKLLLQQKIEPTDRPLVSSYLTFFETVHLLLQTRILNFTLLDNLFRNRFFTAIGNSDVQQMALLSQAGAFRNIHSLIDSWSRYLRAQSIPQHPAYREYLVGAAASRSITIAPLTIEHLADLMALQARVSGAMPDREWLRDNDAAALAACLAQHDTVGARTAKGELIGAAVLFDAGGGPESIKRHITDDEAAIAAAVNLKVVLIDPDHRRSGLARTLVEVLEMTAVARGKQEVLCTIHRRNRPSATLFSGLGYRRVRRVATTYGRRDVYARRLTAEV